MIRTYTELLRLETFEDRYSYLALRAGVGVETFGHDRYLNQKFYTSTQWRNLRNYVIVRDENCDMAVEGREIYTNPVIHHMNPMNAGDIIHGNPDTLDPEYLITVSHATHNAIHYGTESQLPRSFVERRPGDTKLW